MTGPELATLSSAKLEIQLTETRRPVPAQNSLEQWSQSYGTDHMLVVPWDAKQGWGTPKIGPYTNISLPPTASVFHYATSCFEGMKVYRGYDGKARLFRPHLNAARMLRSAQRLCLPSFDPKELENLIVRFAELEARRWAPESRPGTFFYVRPVLMATESTIGLRPPKQAILYIISVSYPSIDDAPDINGATNGSGTSDQAPDLLKGPPKPKGLKLLASAGPHIRAWPGGSGDSKVGANYAPTLVAQAGAQKEGFDQVLWLYGGSGFESNPLVTEAGGANFFVIWKTPGSKLQLITSSLDHGTILPGITRQSILDFAPALFGSELEVAEADYGMEDVLLASREGRLLEAFAAGTAYFVTPVKQIRYQDADIQLPLSEGTAGKYTTAIREHLSGIQNGTVQSEWGVVLDED
ncbi:hypothetical protein DL767_009487 [Monosporascus sp. MG133]|nr:hypothetical protein DL767_009487 [Monosporascus sp. MG133]